MITFETGDLGDMSLKDQDVCGMSLKKSKVAVQLILQEFWVKIYSVLI